MKVYKSSQSKLEYMRQYRIDNLEKIRVAQKEARRADPGRQQTHKLRKFWPGSTRQQAEYNYQTLVKMQNNLCAICNKPETDTRHGRIKRLAVDHCHTTLVVRGLLCANCNRAIGLLKDSEKLLSNAINYLRKGIKNEEFF